MDDQLLTLLDYEGVLGVLATTPDGLVVAAAGIEGDDAEIVGAAGSTLWSSVEDAGEVSGVLEVGSASIHLLLGSEVSLIALTDGGVPHEALAGVMRERLESVTALLA